MVSSSCSTTINVLPKSLNPLREFKSFSLSRWCKPILGSSKIYNTPVSALPICVARRMRWLSPPERVTAVRVSVRYPSPTFRKKPKRLLISLIIASAIRCSVALNPAFTSSINSQSLSTGSSQTSQIFLPLTRTDNASFFKRLPPQPSQGALRIKRSISLFTPSEVDVA